MSATRRVLMIEGSGKGPSSLRSQLESDGFEVESANSAAGAVRRVLQRAYDVVVTSPSTTAGDDIALAQYLQRIQPGLRTIVLASAATPEDVIAALRTHVFACFREPFDSAAIIAMINRIVTDADWRDGISVLSARSDWISLRVAARRLTAERVVSFVGTLIKEPSDGGHDRLITAFREILQNAIEHGAGFDPDKVVEVSAIRTARALVFHFRDPGPGFALDDLPHAAISNPFDEPTAHLEVREARGMRPGGFGILMARSLVDEVIYNEFGNEVILIKYL